MPKKKINKRTKIVRYSLELLVLGILLGLFIRGRITHSGRPNILLISIDTLRADHLGAYGYSVNTSPRIDTLAREGVTFSNCMVQWPKTWPSIASLMTGAHPKTTGLKLIRSYVPPSLESLGKLFRSAGYETGAVVSNFNLGRKFGFHQGFDYFSESWEEKWKEERGVEIFLNQRTGMVKDYTNATIVTNQALSWLKGIGSKKFFLWLHYMEPHGPYKPPDKYKRYFLNSPSYKTQLLEGDWIPDYQVLKDENTGKVHLDQAHYVRRYDQSIRYNDDEISRLLSVMDRRGQLDNTLVVLTADHGESLGEHNYFFEHGQYSYQACAHVPLIIWYPKQLPANKKIAPPVGLIDLSPTLLELAGLKTPDQFEGESLWGLIKGPSPASSRRPVFMEAGYHPQQTQLTIRKDQWKLIHVRHKEDRAHMGGEEYTLFNLAKDPSEIKNVAADKLPLVNQLIQILEGWYGVNSSEGLKENQVDLGTLNKEEREMLKSLGYIN